MVGPEWSRPCPLSGLHSHLGTQAAVFMTFYFPLATGACRQPQCEQEGRVVGGQDRQRASLVACFALAALPCHGPAVVALSHSHPSIGR